MHTFASTKFTLCKFALRWNVRSGFCVCFVLFFAVQHEIKQTDSPTSLKIFPNKLTIYSNLNGGRVLDILYWSNDLLSLTQLVLHITNHFIFVDDLAVAVLITWIQNVTLQSCTQFRGFILIINIRHQKQRQKKTHNKFIWWEISKRKNEANGSSEGKNVLYAK